MVKPTGQASRSSDAEHFTNLNADRFVAGKVICDNYETRDGKQLSFGGKQQESVIPPNLLERMSAMEATLAELKKAVSEPSSEEKSDESALDEIRSTLAQLSVKLNKKVSLKDLADVNVKDAKEGQFLMFSSGKWCAVELN